MFLVILLKDQITVKFILYDTAKALRRKLKDSSSAIKLYDGYKIEK